MAEGLAGVPASQLQAGEGKEEVREFRKVGGRRSDKGPAPWSFRLFPSVAFIHQGFNALPQSVNHCSSHHDLG